MDTNVKIADTIEAPLGKYYQKFVFPVHCRQMTRVGVVTAGLECND
jgi:hypothetical protein